MKRFICLMLVAVCCLSGCRKNDALFLYILPAESVTDAMDQSEIAKLAQKSGRLALEGGDFTGVVWEKQLFKISENAALSVGSVNEECGGSVLLKTTDRDVFVWMLGNQAVYIGGFAPGSSSAAPRRVPFIKDSGRYTFTVQTDDRYGKDVRFNKALYRYFKNAGLLKSELAE